MTLKYTFSVGLVVRRGDRVFDFDRRLSDDTVIFVDQIDKAPHRWKLGDVYRDIGEGRLAVVRGEHASSRTGKENALPLLIDTNSLPKKHREKLSWQVSYVHALRRLGLTRGMRQAVQQEIPKLAERFQDLTPPSVSAILNWWRKLESNDNVITSLVSGHIFKQLPPRKEWAASLIKRIIRLEYCNRNRKTIEAVTALINQQLPAEARALGVGQQEAHVSYNTVRRHIREIDKFALDLARYGASYANNNWRFSLKGTNCTRAMQRYEIDHTILDIVVVSDVNGMPLGRPTITVVVDTYSSYVVGFFVSFWGTGLATTLSCLKVAFGPKDSFLGSGLKVENKWLSMGICELLAMDNGLEFHSPQMRSVALHLDMDLLYCPVRTPWLKPVVERTLGSLNLYLPSQGRVEKPLDNYIPRRADDTCSLPFSALCEGLLMAFVDVHPFEINERKLARPYDLIEESLLRLPPPCLPGPMTQLEIIVGQSTPKVIGNEGVVMNYLRYNSRELQAIRRFQGTRFHTEVRYDPGNLDQVFVRVPKSAQWLVVPSCMPQYTRGLSTVQHRAIRAFCKGELARKGAEEILLRAKKNLQDHWMSSMRVGKRLKAQQLKAIAGLTSAHALQAPVESPSMASAQSTVSAPICEADMIPPLSDIPMFDTESFV